MKVRVALLHVEFAAARQRGSEEGVALLGGEEAHLLWYSTVDTFALERLKVMGVPGGLVVDPSLAGRVGSAVTPRRGEDLT